MKIPRGLPQFEDEPSLIVVAGKIDATLYYAYRGQIEYISSVKVGKPQFDSEKGHFKTRAPGVTTRSGAVNEIKDETIIREFTRKLAELFRKLRGQISLSAIYLLSPGQVREKIKKVLPYEWRHYLRQSISGNYFHFHPTQVLSKITI